jgi:acetolactate synthase-1/2/3 large subunit
MSIPVATTPFGKGVFDARHPLSLGVTGRNGPYPANAACPNADVILALGTRFDDRATSAWLPGSPIAFRPPGSFIDIDAGEIGATSSRRSGSRRRATGLEQLLSHRTDRRPGRDGWLTRIEGWRKVG